MATSDPLFEAVHDPTEAPTVDMPPLLHAPSDIGFLYNMAIGGSAVGKFDQTQAAHDARSIASISYKP